MFEEINSSRVAFFLIFYSVVLHSVAKYIRKWESSANLASLNEVTLLAVRFGISCVVYISGSPQTLFQPNEASLSFLDLLTLKHRRSESEKWRK